jgi:hypothetical protein
MKIILTCFLLSAVVSCSHAPRSTYLPNGKMGFTSRCYYNSAACYNKAGETCSGPYNVVSFTTNRDSDGDDYSTITYVCKK